MEEDKKMVKEMRIRKRPAQHPLKPMLVLKGGCRPPENYWGKRKEVDEVDEIHTRWLFNK